MKSQEEKAIKILNQGGIIIYPTDTAFGIGCRIDHEEAIERLLQIRMRSPNQPTSVLVQNVAMAKQYVEEIPKDVEKKLINKYWPGALTIVLKARKEYVPQYLQGETETLGIRMPNHSMLLSLISRVGVPLLGPSANFHGEKTPYRFDDLDQRLLKLVDFVLPGESGGITASTVIDCTIVPWKIVREGGVSLRI